MSDERRGEMTITAEADLVQVRRAVRKLATAIGFGVADVTRIVTAASELTRNIYLYAERGVVTWQVVEAAGRKGLELTFKDDGPGIPDVARALESGYSTGKGLGLGLPGTKRLMDEMEILSTAGAGTVITVRKWMKS